ncbi:SMI1/KNR4 family protein [Streptomyces radicis]|uniref:SMI1/KNR4 family protein n=1 Tax=Streptomyces radicis TaxID=1750517 RepID=UPI0026D0DE89|nr:SMI1/KNR4 family protein [Streptomyces radicis]
MNDAIWAGVRQRVQALRDRPGHDAVFGAIGHGFALEDVLDPAELAALEDQVGVELPDEYRGFLLGVGAGGAGPAYGVFPVRRRQGRWGWEGDGATLVEVNRLGEPFPRRCADPERLRALLEQRPEEEDFEGTDGFDDAIESWEREWESVMWSRDRTVGAIVIAHLGCALRHWLVVSGPERGLIWADHRVDDEDLMPLLDDEGTPVGFAAWYLTWLTEAERRVAEGGHAGARDRLTCGEDCVFDEEEGFAEGGFEEEDGAGERDAAGTR